MIEPIEPRDDRGTLHLALFLATLAIAAMIGVGILGAAFTGRLG